ncbi:hypothetical protein ACIQWZ_38315 [Streptomyces sp. NPDC098077]|uniref:hypothetical protein n=1 Tax=Streptomyces TaxID=1883 RepID=UPI00343BF777|nr:hypothetical protein OG238_00195 [Streptomyces anulatus]WST90416.1 hypothetical protein OG238_41335 [Streptomyces anulatus]WSW87802.1 hypothetical protein OG536_38610 [Streptomyces anulatus]
MERTDLVAKVLLSMRRRAAIAILARVLYNASDELIAEKLHVTPFDAYRLTSVGMSQLRHPSRSFLLRDVSVEMDEGALVIDRALRSLLEAWRMEEMFGALCSECRRPLEIPFKAGWNFDRARHAGRPRSYCSNACRQKAYRIRRRTAQRDGSASAVN